MPRIVSHDEWVAARTALLVKEKGATNQRDRLNVERRELPMVEVRGALDLATVRTRKLVGVDHVSSPAAVTGR